MKRLKAAANTQRSQNKEVLKTKLIRKIHYLLIISLHFIISYALRLFTCPVSAGWKCHMMVGAQFPNSVQDISHCRNIYYSWKLVNITNQELDLLFCSLSRLNQTMRKKLLTLTGQS